MLAKVFTAGLSGIDGRMVSVEVDESNGLPHSLIIGNVSLSVREALERCTVALKNSGITLPPKRLTISLQPADFHKSGTSFDLAILVGVLASLRMIDSSLLPLCGFFGEVGLNGEILPVRGALSLSTAFQLQGLSYAIVSAGNVAESSVVEGIEHIGVRSVKELLSLLRSEASLHSFPRFQPDSSPLPPPHFPDFKDVQGQDFAIRAALIAAAGGHNLLLSGPAGSGKSMIAKRIPGILPSITRAEDIEVTKVYSVSGLLPPAQALFGYRPFRSPHASITVPALIGGSGRGGILPGELALAAKGVLFLDELPLFSRAALESLRQPMEDKKIVISRVGENFTYPADCMIVAAMNPCPCGYFGSPHKRCTCTPSQIRTYQRGISKPILERLDLCVEVSPVSFSDTLRGEGKTNSAFLRKRVEIAQEIQRKRFGHSTPVSYSQIHQNAEMGISEIKKFCPLGEKEQNFMKTIFTQKQLSMRTYHKILRVSRTIADLEGSEQIHIPHLAEAVSYRGLEDRLYGSA